VNRRELLFALGAWAAAPAWGDSPRRVTLLYPDVPEPERAVFRKIREGVANAMRRAGLGFTEHAVSPAATTDAVSALLAVDRPDVILALGRTLTDLVQTLNPRVPWFTGATELPVPTPSLSGISLVVDPERVLDTLRLVAPRINRVSIVIPPARFGWLKPAIERAGRARNIQTTLFEASSIAEAASHYYNIIRYGNPRADSLWLLEQGQFITPDTLPRLIEWSWAQEFLLFSSVLEHVNEGSLFALYVNPGSLGERLGELAAHTGGRPPPLAFDEAPARAINLRTARHLSNIVDAGVAKSFDLILGER